MTLRWKKVANWNLSQSEQAIWTAVGRSVEYKITRAGTADKPVWRLYTTSLYPATDGNQDRIEFASDFLRDAKYWAERMES